MSTRSYSIVEPHPNPSTSTNYISTGRGGAGNAIRTHPSQITRGADARGPAAAAAAIRASLSSTKSSPPSSHYTSSTKSTSTYNYITSGRGGAGNAFPASERAIFSFDEELERQLRLESDVAPVYHVGRGGAGNLIHRGSQDRETEAHVAGSVRVPVRRLSEESELSMHSDSSRASESGADVFNRSVKKGWKKIMGGY